VQRASLDAGPTKTRPYDIGSKGKVVGLIDAGVGASASTSSPQMQIVLNWFEDLEQRVPTR
jgi:hypothetical protein